MEKFGVSATSMLALLSIPVLVDGMLVASTIVEETSLDTYLKYRMVYEPLFS